MKKTFLLKTLLLLCAIIVGSTSVKAQETTVATFDSDEVVTGSAYADNYGGDDWSINMAGNNKSIGFNNKNCVAIGDALGTGATATNYGIVVKSKNALADVNKITFYYGGGSGDGGKIYLAYSENGTDWDAITLSTGSGLSAQGATVAKETTFTFEFSTISSAYYAIILDKGNTTKAAYRFDNVVVTFINVPSSSSSAEKPTFNPTEGELTKAQNVTISSEGASKIIYTTNGDEPMLDGATTTTVNAASANVLVSGAMTIKAKGVDSSNQPSAMSSAAYTINLAEPVILPEVRTYATTTNISFTQEDNIDVYYTLDGTTPTASSIKYNGTPFAITENLTIKAIAIDEYDNKSDVVEAKFKNSDLQATEVEITNWNTLFGTEFDGSMSGSDIKTYEGTQDNVTVKYIKDTGSNMYMKNNQIRLYSGINLSFEAPAGYVIEKVVFTGTISNDKKPTVEVGVYDNSTKTWKGAAAEVVFYGTATSANITTATVTLARTATITIDAACTDGEKYYATYSNTKPFVASDDITVSSVAVDGEGKLVITDFAAGEVVPANYGVLVSSTIAGEKTIGLSNFAGAGHADQMLYASSEGLTAAEMAAAAPNCEYYRLTMHNGTIIGFWWGAEDGASFAIAANKAYLAVPKGATAKAGFAFNENVANGINALDTQHPTPNTQHPIYNLAGQRVNKSYKGVVIQNGKKMLNK